LARNEGVALSPGDLCGALEEVARERPLVLVFEDIQWADESTLDLVSALARRRALAKLLILASCKAKCSASDRGLKSLKNDLRMHRLCDEVELPPFNRSEVRELLSRELEQNELPAGLDRFVLKRSEGNPLFVRAIADHLRAQQILVRKGGNGTAHWELEHTDEMEACVPGELRQMVELEIERLSEAEQRLLEAGSLIAVAFPAWAVAAALEQDAAETEAACDELARRLHFLERVGQDELPGGSRSAFYVFAHGIYREVLYERQVPSRRARRHVRIAERLGELFAGREEAVTREMALHFEAAGAWARAIDTLCSAARFVRVRSAPGNLSELLERAMTIAANLAGRDREAAMELVQAEFGVVVAAD
jgi:predicted ATPase